MTDITIYDVYWEGPYTLDKIQENIHRRHCLYQIYGDHPCYGRDVLLYIGKTQRIADRLIEHYERFSSQCDSVKIFIGSCGEFESWEKWKEINPYEPISEEMLDAIESLLIYAHQPAYNSAKLYTLSFKKKNFRIFNTNRRKSLMPEISTGYYRDNINEEIIRDI